MKTLAKQIEASIWTWNTPTPNIWNFEQFGGEYTVVSQSANAIIATATGDYIDLAGMSQQEKTMFIESLRVDYQVPPDGVNPSPGDQLNIMVIVSDVPATGLSFIGPGFAMSDMDAQNCAICLNHVWTWTQDAASYSALPQLTSVVSNGLMTSTSSDRLYVSVYQRVLTQKIGSPTSNLEKVTVPGLRIVADVQAKEEPEYQYLMRLRRSYELQNS